MTIDPHQYEPWMMYQENGGELVFSPFPDEEDLGFVDVSALPSFLEVHRDQSLWLACISGLNPDGDVVGITNAHKWILSQPDCDNVVAVAAWSYWASHRCCGLPWSQDLSVEQGHVIPHLISDRSRLNPFATGALSDPWPEETRATLLLNALAEATKLGTTTKPLVTVPVKMLELRPAGRKPKEGYQVEETGLTVVRIPSH